MNKNIFPKKPVSNDARRRLIDRAIKIASSLRYKSAPDKKPRRPRQEDLASMAVVPKCTWLASPLSQNAIYNYRNGRAPKLEAALKLQNATEHKILWFEFILGRMISVEELKAIIEHKENSE